jgi:cell fate regulator YaaT (PSP1 superfamily)
LKQENEKNAGRDSGEIDEKIEDSIEPICDPKELADVSEELAGFNEDDEYDQPSSDDSSSAKLDDVRHVGVVFIDGKVGKFNPKKLSLSVGDTVVVDNDRDLNLGKVVYIQDGVENPKLRRVLRRVGPEDFLLIRRNKKREEEASALCKKMIGQHKLQMKLIRVAYLHGGNKAIFYFSADGRVDFRGLVRDLAQQLHVRIEMRQIGVRDESKMLGGIGICGQQLCCGRFLRKFVPVSIKMAKNQSLALNPQKLSGLCGRLMCCLVYEEDTYNNLRKDLPKIGSMVNLVQGKGKVVDLDIFRKQVSVMSEKGLEIYDAKELTKGQQARPIGSRAIDALFTEEPSTSGVTNKKEQEKDSRKEQKQGQRPSKRRRRRRSKGAEGKKKASSGTNNKESKRPGTKESKSSSDPNASKTSKSSKRRRSRRRSRNRRRKESTAPNRPDQNKPKTEGK